MAHDDQFTATGPAFTGAGFPRAAFSTNRKGTDSTYGVNVQGSECGVYGESVDASGQSQRETPEVKTGVCGIGEDYGVFGEGRTVAGVRGDAKNDSVIGVVGMSKNKQTPQDFYAGGIGILGATESMGGFGVVGLSARSLTLTHANQVAHPGRDPETGNVSLNHMELGPGTGVFGASGIFPPGALGRATGVYGVGGTGVAGSGVTAGVEGECDSGFAVVGRTRAGVGVEGDSDSGTGVVGRSTSGAGGFFTSFSSDAVVGRSGGPGDGVRGQADSGIGVRGVANTGPGVFGDSEKQSGVIGRSGSNSAPGVFGVSELFTGVAGRSTSKPGVYGDSTKEAGVMGRSASSAGVFGFGDAAFQVPGPPAGVLGVNDKSVGVLGSSLNVIGVWGNTNKGLGVVGITNSGAGVPTDQITDQGIGVIGLTNAGIGVAGMSTSGTGVFGSCAKGLAGHFKGAVVIEGDFTVKGGVKSAVVPHPDGSHRQLYCMESPESWFEDFGEAKLVDGKAEVRLDPDFAALVDAKGYHVFLTPYGESKGMFVGKRTAIGFHVSEQQRGTSNVRFAYRVVAKRKDVVAGRLKKVKLPAVSKDLQLPKLRLKIKSPDFERLSVSPLDPPSTRTRKRL